MTLENAIKTSLWSQFGASIEALEKAILLCPESHWDTERKFWYLAYHTLFFLDYYLTLKPENFHPPAPFTLSEFEDGLMPERTYTKKEILDYLHFCYEKCHQLIAEMTSETAQSEWINSSGSMKYNVVEILLYNMRHVQHHTAQLNMILRAAIDDAPRWVFKAKKAL